jgi:hypothetical protein
MGDKRQPETIIEAAEELSTALRQAFWAFADLHTRPVFRFLRWLKRY